jgi:hypothetical protein
VEFEHDKKKYSGVLKVDFSDGGQSATMVLKRDKERFTISMSGRQVAATDGDGRSMVARYDKDKQRWTMDAQSEQRFNDNIYNFGISFAIAGDLAPKVGSASMEVAAVEIGQATCNRNRQLMGNSDLWLVEHEACQDATDQLIPECKRAATNCDDCCEMDPCWCACLGDMFGLSPIQVEDFACSCFRTGYPYKSSC